MSTPSTARRLTRTLLAFTLAASSVFAVAATSSADGAEHGPYFGAGNIPAMCVADLDPTSDAYWLDEANPNTVCHHMRTDMNGLDSPQVDVLVLVPVSPTAERDARIMRQAIETWEQGIEFIAGQLNMQWLAEGMEFHITVAALDPTAAGEFTTYPVVDPEIVVIASNPVGGIGIGIDPLMLFGMQGFCHGIANPFDVDAWEALPGFDSHHEERGGIYNEDCGGAGGNICFAVNGAIDPLPAPDADIFSLFDLVTHEVGHCLTIGHVGDGAEGAWGGLPPNDIMAYDLDPVALNKCVSTLDVESIATVMSRYLDVNGDGVVDAADELLANDTAGDGSNPFMVQRPDEHLYASATGSPLDCPQPDLGLLPGDDVSFTPETDWPQGTHPAQAAGGTDTSGGDTTTGGDGTTDPATKVNRGRAKKNG